MYITSENVEFVLDSVVRRYPDRRNTSSQYTSDRGDHCLAGIILLGLGCPVPGPEDGCNEAPFDSTPVQAWYASKGVDFSIEAEQTIRQYQDAADYGVKWGEQRTWSHAIAAPLDFAFQ